MLRMMQLQLVGQGERPSGLDVLGGWVWQGHSSVWSRNRTLEWCRRGWLHVWEKPFPFPHVSADFSKRYDPGDNQRYVFTL